MFVLSEKYIGYVYLIENVLNGKQYVGKRSWAHFPTIDEKYWGSGVAIKKAIAKYGTDSFSRQVLCWCATQEELASKEIEFIKAYSPAYNLVVGSVGGDQVSHNPNLDEIKKKISQGIIKANKRNPEKAFAHYSALGKKNKNKPKPQEWVEWRREVFKSSNPMKNVDSIEKMKSTKRTSVSYVIKICSCGRAFQLPPNKSARKFCSRICYKKSIAVEKENRICENCSTTFGPVSANSTKRFCQSNCFYEWNRKASK